MTDISIEFATPQFWAFVGVALLLLIPVRKDSLHQPLFFLVNAAFVWLVIGIAGLAGVILLVFLLTVLTRMNARSLTVAWLLASALIALLVAVKLSGASTLLPSYVAVPLGAIGFSYFCLRGLDMLRTVYGGQHAAPDFVELFNYLLPFNMLAAGPIQGYVDYRNRPAQLPSHNLNNTLTACERIAAGVFKKFVLAGALAGLFLTDFKATGPYLFVEMHVFYVWLFLDFSAYSDIAVGLGALMGIQTPENFNRPLTARNLTVFWQRWHISLARFIRNNLYIPVQLNLARRTANRHPVLVSTIAFVVAFVLCGLWHDISWRFFLWGCMHAAGLSICNAYRYLLVNKFGAKYVREVYMKNRLIRWLATIITFEFVAVSLLIAFYPYSGAG